MKYAFCKYKEDEKIVQNNLALTPAQIDDFARRGVPVSTHNLSDTDLYEGDTNPSFDLPLNLQRGVDVNEMWNVEMSVKKSARKAFKQTKDAKAAQEKLTKELTKIE